MKTYTLDNIFSDLVLKETVEKHATLNPKLWTKANTLKPEVTLKIRDIVGEFLNQLAEDSIQIFVDDILLVGSNCSYNYTKDSDLDIHIIANTKNLACPDNLYAKLYSAYRTLFNKKFDINFYDIPVELYVETDETPRVSNGCYSVVSQSWISKPVLDNIPDIDQTTIDSAFENWDSKYKALILKIENSTDYEKSIEAIDQYLTDIYDLRKKSLPTEGEYGIGNLIFKEIRNCGYLDSLKELRNKLLSLALSLDPTDKEKLSEEILEPSKQDYEAIIIRETGKSPIIHANGMFELYNIHEQEVARIQAILSKLSFVSWVNKAQTRFAPNPANLNGLPVRYFKIYGQLK